MKKKDKEKKKPDMPEFSFKEFTPDEDKIYEEAIGKFRSAIAGGKTLRQAYESCAIADKQLEALIQADFLKIIIAERHFTKRESLEQIATDLNVPSDLVRDTHARMLQEVGVSAANQFSQQIGGLESKTND
jgi:hypothetical protein